MQSWLRNIRPVPASGRNHLLSLVLGMAFWVWLQTYGIQWRVIVSREQPPEADDAYSYIVKAAELRECPLQDCKALVSLREQLSKGSEDQNVYRMRERQYHRVLNLYTITHAGVLLLFHGVGLGWEAAYALISIAGSVFMGLCLWAWFAGMISPIAASLALGICALTIMPTGHGIHWVVPNTLCLAGGLFTWAMATSRRPGIGWALPPTILALCFMHPTGVVYSGMALIAFVWSGGLKGRYRVSVSVISAAAIVLHRLLLMCVTRPSMTYLSLGPPLPFGEWVGQVLGNLRSAPDLLTSWFGSLYVLGRLVFAWLVFPATILAVGLTLWLAGDKQQRQRIGLYGLLSAGVLGVGICYVLPGHPGEGVTRLGMPLILFITAAFAQAFCVVIGWAGSLLGRSRHGKATMLGIVPAVVAAAVMGWFFYKGMNGLIRPSAAQMANRKNTQAYDAAQTRLLSSLPPGGVLYLSETAMYFHLSYGALANEAVFYSAVHGSEDEARWLQSNTNLRYCVSHQPMARYRLSGSARMTVMRGSNTSARAELSARFTVRGAPVRVRVGASSVELPVGQSTWMKIDVPSGEDAVTIYMEAGDDISSVWVTGIRDDESDPLAWPWDRDIQVVWQADGNEERHEFKSAALVPPPFRVVRILHDSGASVLCQIGM